MSIESLDSLGIHLSVLYDHHLPVMILQHLPIALFTLPDFRSELAHFLDLFLFFVPFAIDSALDLIAPDLVSLKKA